MRRARKGKEMRRVKAQKQQQQHFKGFPNQPPEQQTVPPARSRIAEMRRLIQGFPCASVFGATPIECLTFDNEYTISAGVSLPAQTDAKNAFAILADPENWPTALTSLESLHMSPDPRFFHASVVYQQPAAHQPASELPFAAAITRFDIKRNVMDFESRDGLPINGRVCAQERSQEEQDASTDGCVCDLFAEIIAVIPDEFSAFIGAERVQADLQEEMAGGLWHLLQQMPAGPSNGC